MFSLHETIQRRVCRAAFVVCAVVPMVATLAFVTYSLRPWREADWQRTFLEQLHVRATVEHVSSPRPGVTRLSAVQLADLRTGLPLGSLGEVQVQRNGSQLVLNVKDVHIEAGQLSALATAIATWLSTDDLPAVEMLAMRVSLTGKDQQTLPLTNVLVQTESKEGQSNRLGIQADSLRLLVERQSKTVTTIDTGATHLPAWVLADLLPSLNRSQDATFAGSLRVESDARTSRGTLRGRIENLALHEWIGPGTQYQIHGAARVEFDQLEWHGDRTKLAHGRLFVADGGASRSLLAELEKRLLCVLGPGLSQQPAAESKLEPFDELACDFQLSEAGLTVAGQCRTSGTGTPGCLLARGGQPLLLEPRYANLPVAQLVQVLAQPAASWLPATAEAHDMAGKLPLPSSTKAEVASRPEDSPPR